MGSSANEGLIDANIAQGDSVPFAGILRVEAVDGRAVFGW